jgi:ribosomal protein S18 acetylase RimI-like enzyme
MELTLRPARPDDAAADLLYLSAQPYYDAFAGSSERARRILRAIYRRPRHTASWDICRIAESEGAIVGIVAGFPLDEGNRRARRFLVLSVPRLPLSHWPALMRHVAAAARVSPPAPVGSWYVDALAVAPEARRQGVARALLADAAECARSARATTLALDTAIDNAAAQALYESSGFERGNVREADERTARAVRAPGFVGYSRRVV